MRMMEEYPETETKGDRRAKKRHKNQTSHIGVPSSKIRMTGDAEVRLKVRVARKRKQSAQNGGENNPRVNHS